jgi:hypothetical protein
LTLNEWSFVMKNLIAKPMNYVSSWLNAFQIKRFLTIALIGFLVLTTNAVPNRDSRAMTNRVNQTIHQDDSDRPKTTGEWNREAREVEGKPGERFERIAKQSGEAVKDFGSLYPDTAERSGNQLQDSQGVGNPFSNRGQR